MSENSLHLRIKELEEELEAVQEENQALVDQNQLLWTEIRELKGIRP